jgi:hypothetical protein
LAACQAEEISPAVKDFNMFGGRNQSPLQLAPIAWVNPQSQAALPQADLPVIPQLSDQLAKAHTRERISVCFVVWL